ncbi:MAG: Tar ligand binding domain-containing protein, partial [Pseudomonadota bacterium]
MKLVNLKIGSRLVILIGGLLALLIGVGAMGLLALKDASNEMEMMYAENMKQSHRLDEINYLMTRNRLNISNTLLDPTADNIAKYTAEVEANIGTIGALWKDFSATHMPGEQAKLAQQYADTRKLFVEKGLRPAVTALRGGELKEARRIALEQIQPLYDATKPNLDALAALIDDDGKSDYESSFQRYQTTRTQFIAVIGLGLLFAIGFGWVLVRSITVPLAKAVDLSKDMAAGRLDTTIAVDGTDEVASLLGSMAETQTALREAAVAAEFNERMRIALEGVDSNV